MFRVGSLVGLAAGVRLAYIAFVILASLWISDYDTSSEVSRCSAVLQPFGHWDAHYFTAIATSGGAYDFENFYAFFPLYPFLMRALAEAFGPLTRCTALFAGIVISNSTFLISVAVFHLLSTRFLSHKAAVRSTLLYIFNPASIFLTAAYTESPFALATLTGMYLLLVSHRSWLATLSFVIAAGIRSNGAVCAGFLILSALQSRSIVRIMVSMLQTLLVALPSVIHQAVGMYYFCPTTDARPYCESRNLYGYVQSRYWGVGLFKYYTLKQIPNFVLAAPILYVSAIAIYRYVKKDPVRFFTANLFGVKRGLDTDKRDDVLLPFYYYWVILAGAGVTVMHVQVLTRFLASCPPLFWFLGEICYSSTRVRFVVFLYCGAYMVLGALMFGNFYPWT
eukprot:ANDGO_04333.mRNA.1 GPI mannosyltransferase 2